MESTEHYFVGTWRLLEWKCFVDGKFHSHPFEKDSKGILIYTKDKQMSAILMKPDRVDFKIPILSKGSQKEKIMAVDGYVSYAGKYEVVGEVINHHVKLSLLPNWIDKILKRKFQFSEDYCLLKLITVPEKHGNRSVVQELVWERNT